MLTRRSVSHGDVPSCVCVLLHSCVPLLTLGEKNEGVRCSAVLSNMSVPTSCDRLMLVFRKFSSFLSSYLNQPLKANRNPFIKSVQSYVGEDPAAHLPALRRLFWESHTLAVQDMRDRFEARPSQEPKKLSMPDRVDRLKRLKTNHIAER